jgi:hypothetical protein
MTESFSGAAGYNRSSKGAGASLVDIGRSSSVTDLSRIDLFNAVSKGAVVTHQEPQQNATLLGSLAPNVDFKVDSSAAQKHAISVTSTNAIAPRVETNMRAVENVSTQIDQKMNLAKEIMQDAKDQVHEIMKDTKVSSQDITGKDSQEVGKAVGIALDVMFAGAGSVVTAIAGAAVKTEQLDGLKGKSRDEKLAIMAEAAQSRASANSLHAQFSKTDNGPKPENKADLANAVKMRGPDVFKEILSADLNKIDSPEMKALEAQKMQVDGIREGIQTADKEKYNSLRPDEVRVALNSGKNVEDVVPASVLVADAHETIPALKGIKLKIADIADMGEGKNAADAAPGLDQRYVNANRAMALSA